MGFYADRGVTFESARDACKIEVDTWYGGKVLDVFDSSATGTLRRYYCSEADQLRMINGRLSNSGAELMCGVPPADSDADPVYSWLQHTSSEAGKVHSDYVAFSKSSGEQRKAWLARLDAATTLAEVDAVFAEVWG